MLTGCGNEPDAVDVYQVRGVITALPDPADATTNLMVHHEAIPEFIGFDGTSQPMAEMTMPFPTPEGVLPADAEVGDKVSIQLEVTRGENPGYRATRVQTLADDTTLDLSGSEAVPDAPGTDTAAPPADDHADHPH